jgi:hypothetical protein
LNPAGISAFDSVYGQVTALLFFPSLPMAFKIFQDGFLPPSATDRAAN